MMMYRNYIETLAKRFEAAFSTIEAGYNFDFGPEFEIALCRMLRTALPTRFGVSRASGRPSSCQLSLVLR